MLAEAPAPPAVVGAALTMAGSTSVAVTATASAMVAVGGAWWQAGRLREEAKANSPVGYLLDVRDRFTPKTFAARARKVLRGTYGRG